MKYEELNEEAKKAAVINYCHILEIVLPLLTQLEIMKSINFLLDNETNVTLSELIEANQTDPLTENEIHELMLMFVLIFFFVRLVY